ncbi:hypothetical protein [Anaeroselena agilis]|uniref:Uncharacterized protein n=1 Tax=Anaeroselena agilis TaxID=3063788 RepID=A0ABU3NVV2_9FIRM|nr:hypothetical protein [Selenomonadales bacterium 4137-cl]
MEKCELHGILEEQIKRHEDDLRELAIIPMQIKHMVERIDEVCTLIKSGSFVSREVFDSKVVDLLNRIDTLHRENSTMRDTLMKVWIGIFFAVLSGLGAIVLALLTK